MKLNETLYLEGPNGAGKSTLAKALGEKLHANVMHTGGPKSTPDDLKHTFWLAKGSQRIIDRCPPISQIAYDQALERPALVPHENLLDWLAMLESPIVIYCRPPAKFMWVELGRKTHPEEHAAAVEKNLQTLVHEYDTLMWQLEISGLIRCMHYDWTESPTIDNLIEVLKEVGICAD